MKTDDREHPEVGTESVDGLMLDAVCGSSMGQCSEREVALPEVGTIVDGKYRLERLLGQGGMGAVFASVHLVTGKRVALKWLRATVGADPQAAARLAREARAIGRIDHANVVSVFDAGIAGARPYIVMELLDGESLEERVLRGPLSVQEGVPLMVRALRGVAAAHAAGVVHRDLKPANIFVCRSEVGDESRVKVLDFGISKLSVGEGDELLLTTGNTTLGTPMFMAPEQVCGDPIDERTDVYAASITLYYVFTGRFPYAARTRQELFSRIVTGQAVPVRSQGASLPVALEELITQGMQHDPARRHPSVEAMVQALERVAASNLRGRPSTRARRGLSVAALCGAVGLAVWGSLNAHSEHRGVPRGGAPEANGGPVPAREPPQAGSYDMVGTSSAQTFDQHGPASNRPGPAEPETLDAGVAPSVAADDEPPVPPERKAAQKRSAPRHPTAVIAIDAGSRSPRADGFMEW